jgi:hypothetical protein
MVGQAAEEKEEERPRKKSDGAHQTHFPKVKGAKDYFDGGGGDGEDGLGNEQGLSALEIQFLKAVSHSNLPQVRHCINEGVNLGVKNSFGR